MAEQPAAQEQNTTLRQTEILVRTIKQAVAAIIICIAICSAAIIVAVIANSPTPNMGTQIGTGLMLVFAVVVSCFILFFTRY